MAGESKKLNLSTAEDVEAYIAQNDVKILDACFVDPLGTWQHCSYTPSQSKAKDLTEGFAFDGSSIKLFTTIDKSDMTMIPVPTSAWIDPFCEYKTLHVTCFVRDPAGNPFSRCPRGVAMRAMEFVRSEGIADEAFFGPEPEFFVFDDVKYSVQSNRSAFEVDGIEGPWQSSLRKLAGNQGHRGGPKSYYFPVAPQDSAVNLRSEMLLTMHQCGLPVEKHHHEVASCQHELGFTFSDILETADNVMTYKYVVKNVAHRRGKTATFMPKPIAGDNGSGMHCHQSLWKDGKNLFFDEEASYFNISESCMHYIGGLLKHSPAVLAFTNPTVNSYKRLVPGFEAPSSLVFSKGNRSAAIRIPLAGAESPKAKRIEFRCPDAACNPYLAFAAMMMAGVDGMKNKITPPEPVDRDIYELPAEEKAKIQSTPASLEEALDALENDHEFLTVGGVFTEDFIKSYIDFKRAEAKACGRIPTPKEYELYYHC